ncbi:MAG TPA: alpha/beta hydrolase, partial [Flavobacterium sp.]|nr:alpha/beta hydrolase [Flavobacterium sp.]
MKKITTKNIVFISGAAAHHSCWDNWKSYFETNGFSAVAPPWPFKNASAADLRNKRPNDKDLAALTLDQLVNHYIKIVKAFPEKPIVIGHSIGGLVAQILVNKNLVQAGIALHSAPPAGVFPYEFTVIKTVWKSIASFISTKKTYLMPFKTFQNAVFNDLPLEMQKEVYEKFLTPESKKILWGIFTKAARIDYK